MLLVNLQDIENNFLNFREGLRKLNFISDKIETQAFKKKIAKMHEYLDILMFENEKIVRDYIKHYKLKYSEFELYKNLNKVEDCLFYPIVYRNRKDLKKRQYRKKLYLRCIKD